jgi:ABC-type multidrug transport system fused ATPase/permease subunit
LFTLVKQILTLIDRTVRARLIAYVLMSVVATLLESVGLALIFVLFKIVVRPAAIEEIGAVAGLRRALGNPEDSLFLAILCGVLFATLLVKIVLQLLVAWLRLGLEWRTRIRLSRDLFAAYLRGPYATVSRRNTGEIVNTVWSGVGQVGSSTVGLADLVGDGLLVVCINATLFYMEPILTVAALGLLSTAAVLYIVVGRSHFDRWGRKSKAASERMFAAVTEPLAGVKQIKTLGIEEFFVGRFREQIGQLARLAQRNVFAGQSLKPLLEFLVIAGMLGPIAIMLARGLPVIEVVPILALFGTAAYRLLPSFVRMSNTLQSLQFARPVISLVKEDLARLAGASITEPAIAAPARFSREIRLERISFTYRDAAEPVLSDISLTIRRGQSIGLVGTSGAGKTTLVDIVLGLLEPNSGSVFVDGQPLGKGCHPTLFGYVPQESFLVNDTIRRNIALGADRIDDAELRRAIEAASLTTLIDDLPEGLDTVIGERGLRLSGGQRQRIAIARAIYNQAEVLILDESTSSLDATTEATVSDAIYRLRNKRTLIIIAHRLSTVRDCDRLFLIQAGRLADEGSFTELLARNAAFRSMVREMELSSPLEPAAQSAR